MLRKTSTVQIGLHAHTSIAGWMWRIIPIPITGTVILKIDNIPTGRILRVAAIRNACTNNDKFIRATVVNISIQNAWDKAACGIKKWTSQKTNKTKQTNVTNKQFWRFPKCIVDIIMQLHLLSWWLKTISQKGRTIFNLDQSFVLFLFLSGQF